MERKGLHHLPGTQAHTQTHTLSNKRAHTLLLMHGGVFEVLYASRE